VPETRDICPGAGTKEGGTGHRKTMQGSSSKGKKACKGEPARCEKGDGRLAGHLTKKNKREAQRLWGGRKPSGTKDRNRKLAKKKGSANVRVVRYRGLEKGQSRLKGVPAKKAPRDPELVASDKEETLKGQKQPGCPV